MGKISGLVRLVLSFLWNSRRMWLFIVDFVFGFATLLIQINWPQYYNAAITIFGYLQPLIVALVILLTVEGTLRALAKNLWSLPIK